MTYDSHRKKGFTLVELMVVSAIIALLASVVLGSLGTAKAKSRDTERVQELKAFQTALELYQLEKGYPDAGPTGLAQGDDLAVVMAGIVDAGFLSEIPTPPKGSAYSNEVYSYQTTEQEGNYSCQGKSLISGQIPYILYFYTELPQKLSPLIDNFTGFEVTNTYCLTI